MLGHGADTRVSANDSSALQQQQGWGMQCEEGWGGCGGEPLRWGDIQ